MNRVTQHLLCVSWALIHSLPCHLHAGNPAPATHQRVQQVLKLEAQPGTGNLDRRQVLDPLARPATAALTAWWQAGFVKTAAGWQDIGVLPKEESDTTTLAEYRSKRAVAPATMQGQLSLADWCHISKLPQQERAHLTQVLTLASANFNPVPIYKRLGYRLIGNRWLSLSEQHDLEASLRRTREQIGEWKPTVDRICRNWMGNPRQRTLAQQELSEIKNVSAIPALMAASRSNESLAIAICTQLATLPSFEASQALATIAVRSDSPSVRRAASRNLSGRKIDDFAPALLAEMRSLFSSDHSDAPTPNLIIREEADRYVAVQSGLVSVGPAVSVHLKLKTGMVNATAYVDSRGVIDQDRRASDLLEGLQLQIDDENDRAEEYNQRAAAVMAEVTSQEMSVDPRYWWAWWHLYTATEPIPKNCQVIRKGIPVRAGIHFSATYTSCLTAGTPIRTRHGFIAIDQVQVGDEVLSKNINTGEIDYRPVLQTTKREPVPVTKFSVAGSTIIASAGHHFWISGTGWSKTRELEIGRPIHTATGMWRIDSVEVQPDPAPVYNLVVADFHTYFVGRDMVLSHDVTQPQPTNVKVPGLDVD